MAHRNPRMAGTTIYLAPGFYELIDSVPNPYTSSGAWAAGTKFFVTRHIDKIGNQLAYEYFSLRLANREKILLSSYQRNKWNIFATHLIPAKNFGLRVVD